MVIIYRGSRPLLPIIACQVHFANNTEMLKRIDNEIKNEWNWCIEPLAVIGRDERDDIVCCLVHGRHGSIYHRALEGVSRIFDLNSCIIDIDSLMAKKASSHLWMATCLDLVNWPLDRYTQQLKTQMKKHILRYIAGEAGDNR